MIGAWLDGAPAIPVLDEASVSLVRERVREEGARVGLPAEATAKLVNVASELGNNQLAHAAGGVIAVVEIARGGVRGLEVRAADRGRGIADPAGALRGGESTAGTLGIGLAAVLELAGEVDIDVRRGEGTCVRARTFASEVERAREIGVFAQPFKGETVNGDGAFVRRRTTGVDVIAIDALGHGEEARDATKAAIDAARKALDGGPEAVLHECHAAIRGTRGVAMTIAAFDDGGDVTLAGVGNVMAYVVGPQAASRFTGSAGFVGSPGPLRKITIERLHVTPFDAVLLFSDGVTSGMSLEDDLAFLREAPVVIAQRTLERFARGNDDAIVVVAR